MRKKRILKEITRPARESRAAPLIKSTESWRKVWWGMPEYIQRDVSPQFQVTLNFVTREDMRKFEELTGCKILRQNSAWFPNQPAIEQGVYCYDGPPTDSKYPVCIPSKGRAKNQSTGRVLAGMGVSHKFFVEETEADEYIEQLGEDRVVAMPFHDLGKGSIPARNFIWNWSREREFKRHWIMDDNIVDFGRTNFNRRLIVRGGGFFQAMENFVDRYENVVMAGPHNRAFITDRLPVAPYIFNHRVYSCILLDNSLNTKWRGKYNEDTDLSLRLLKKGYCTLLFRALFMSKAQTHKGDGKSGIKGGNTDNVYEEGDYRLKFAKSLQKQHPDVVKIAWRFGRWHHSVNYDKFKNKPILRDGVVPIAESNEYEMFLSKKEKGESDAG